MSSDRASNAAGPVLNSAYYRERFGSQSPEEYKSLRLTNMDPQINSDELRDIIDKIFSRYGDMTCKLVRQSDIYERIAYVNFDFPEDAKHAKRQAGPKVTSLLGRKVRVDPANVVKDQTGKVLRRTQVPQGWGDPIRRSRSPTTMGSQDTRYRQGGNVENYAGPGINRAFDQRKSGGRPSSPSNHPRPTWTYTAEEELVEDPFASRTLFVGNLELDISISELRRFFERFGTVEEIDIKTPHEANTAYAFVRFSDILSAREARKQCCGEYLRDNRCKIGWGKPIISRRLWVGGLGPETSLAWLEKEFDRFGAIEKIDFARGDNHAYILFTSQEAAVEAWKKLKGIKMRNGVLENVVQVDYSDASLYEQAMGKNGAAGSMPRGHNSGGDARRGAGDYYRRRVSVSPVAAASGKRRRSSENSPEAGRRRRSPAAAPTSSRKRQRNGVQPETGSAAKDGGSKKHVSPQPQSARLTGLAAAAEFSADTLSDLYEMKSPLWTGVLVLKRSAYPMQLYKLAGDDDLVDAYMRNDRGESQQLNVTQRLKLDQPRTGEILRVSAQLMQNSVYMLAVPNPNVHDDVKLADMQSKHLRLLVKYFKDKEAAGVVSTLASSNSGGTCKSLPPTGVVYAFPQCAYANDFMATLCPKLAVWQEFGEQCLLLVLQRGTN